MIGKVIATAILLLLAFYAFWDDVLGAGNLFGILFLFFAAVAWHRWEVIREAFSAAKGESQLPTIWLSAKIIGGMQSLRRGSQRRRSPSH